MLDGKGKGEGGDKNGMIKFSPSARRQQRRQLDSYSFPLFLLLEIGKLDVVWKTYVYIRVDLTKKNMAQACSLYGVVVNLG